MSEQTQTIGIAGAGAWGTALANAAAIAGNDVVLWMRSPEQAAALAATRSNARFLPGVALHERIQPTADLVDLASARAVLLVTPAQTTRDMTAALASALPSATPLVLCAKGIERGTGAFLCDVVEEMRPGSAIAVLSGPSFADDVARGLPTAVTIAAKGDLASQLQASLGSAAFRPYASDDLIGVALGGAAKNVYAIACGVVEGMGLGENARAALLARSFAELSRLGENLGAKRETLMGLSGLGDLVLTATSPSSRNFSFGIELGRGKTLAELNAPGHALAEGVATAPALVKRARASGVEMPIAEAMADLLSGALPLGESVMRLMSRKLTVE